MAGVSSCALVTGPQHRRGMQPVFIVGCPRPGTTLLQALLASHPDVHSLPETHFLQSLLRCEDQRRYARATPAQWWRSVREWRRGAMAAAGWAGPRRVRRSWAGMPELAQSAPASIASHPCRIREQVRAFERAWQAQCRHAGKHVWIEKTPDHLFYLDHLRRHMPHARVIHLLRDGEEVVASLYAAGLEHAQWQGFRDVGRAVDRWNRAAAESLRWLGQPGHELVRHEALLADPEGVLSRLCRFIGCDERGVVPAGHGAVLQALIRDDEPWKQARGTRLHDRRKFAKVFDPATQAHVRARLRPIDWAALSTRPDVIAGMRDGGSPSLGAGDVRHGEAGEPAEMESKGKHQMKTNIRPGLARGIATMTMAGAMLAVSADVGAAALVAGGTPPRDPGFGQAMQDCAKSVGMELPVPPSGKAPAVDAPKPDMPPPPPAGPEKRKALDACLAGKGFERPAGPPPDGPMPPPPPPDPGFMQALQDCAKSTGLEPAAAPGSQGADKVPPAPLEQAKRKALDACLAGKGFERPAGPPPGRAMPPPRDPEFVQALQGCAKSVGIELPPAPGTRPEGRAAGEGDKKRAPLAPGKRKALDACLAGKGFDRPAGPPPPHPED